MSSSSRLWFDGRISPCSMTRSAFGRPRSGARCAMRLERGLAQRVAGPDHAGVDAVAFHVLLGTSTRARPDSGRISTGNMCQAVSTSGVVRGSTNTSGRCANRSRQAREVVLARREVVGELVELDEPERGRELGRLEVPADLVEDEEVVVLEVAVDRREEAPVDALARTVDLRPRIGGPSGAGAGSGRRARRRRGTPCRRCRPR